MTVRPSHELVTAALTGAVGSLTGAELERLTQLELFADERQAAKIARREIRSRCKDAGSIEELADAVRAGDVSALSAIADLLR